MEPDSPAPIQLPLPGSNTQPTSPFGVKPVGATVPNANPDPLAALDQNQMGSDPLAAMSTPLANPAASIDDETIDRRTMLHSIGKLVDDPDHRSQDIFDRYAAIQQSIGNQIKSAGDEGLRQEQTYQEGVRKVNNMASLANDQAADVNNEARSGAKIALRAALIDQTAREQNMATERNYTNSLFSLIKSGQVGEAAMLQDEHRTPNGFSYLENLVNKRAIMQRAIEEAGVSIEQRNPMLNILDAALGMVLPFANTVEGQGSYQTEHNRNFLGDLFNPGDRRIEEARSFWHDNMNLSDETFYQHVGNLTSAIKNTHSIFGYNPELLTVGTLANFNVSSPSLEVNAENAFNNAPVLAPLTLWAAKTPIRLTRALMGAGGRSEVASITASYLSRIEKGESVADIMKSTGMTQQEIEESLSHASTNPNIGDYAPISTATDGTARYEAGKKAFEDIRGIVSNRDNLTEAESSAAIEAAINEAKAGLANSKDTRAILDHEVRQVKTSSGGTFRDLWLTLGKVEKNGDTTALFKTEHAANKFGRSTGIADMEAVQPAETLTRAEAETELAHVNDRVTLSQDVDANYEAAVARKGALEGALKKSPGDTVQVIQTDGGWAVKVRWPVNENGFYTPQQDVKATGAFGLIGRRVLGGRQLLPKDSGADSLYGLAGRSGDQRNKMVQIINKQVLPHFTKLGFDEAHTLAQIMTFGERQGTWFDTNQFRLLMSRFNGKIDTGKMLDAYHAYIKANDIEYFLRNEAERTPLAKSGYQDVTISDERTGFGKVIAQVMHDYKYLPNERVRILRPSADGKTKFWDDLVKQRNAAGFEGDGHRLTPDELERLLNQGYKLVRTRDAQSIIVAADKDPITARYYLVKGNDLKIEPLRNDIVPYRAGGHRMYSDPWWVKRARSGIQPDTNEKYSLSPDAYINGSKEEATSWANMMEDARQVYNSNVKSGIKGDEMEQHLQEVFDSHKAKYMATPKEFITEMEEGGSQHAFEALYDRDQPSFYNNNKTFSGHTDYRDPDQSGLSTYMQTQGRMYTSAKGAPIRNWMGDYASTYDPFQVLNKSLSNVASLSSFPEFKLRSTSQWVKTFQQHLDMSNFGPETPAMKIFLEGQFKSTSPAARAIKQTAEGQRDVIRRVLGWQSDTDQMWQQSVRQFQEWVTGKFTPGTKGNDIAHSFTDWMSEKDPLNFMKRMAFNSKLGFGNVSQFPMQIQTAVGAVTIDPEFGMKAMINLPMHAAFNWAKTAKQEANLLKFFIDGGWHERAGFPNPKDFELSMRELKTQGLLSVKDTHIMKQEFGFDAAQGDITSGADWQKRLSFALARTNKGMKDFENTGRIFFDSAEEFNRTVAHSMGWQRIIKENPGLEVGSSAFKDLARAKSGDYFVNMDEAGASWWQKGIPGVPTQFLGYMAHWNELFFGKNLEAMFEMNGKQLTTHLNPLDPKAQKMRMFLGQAFLYGSAGIPFVSAIEQWQRAKGDGTRPDISTLPGMVDRGFYDWAIWATTGANVDFSSRAGMGDQPAQLAREMLNMSSFGEVSFADVLLGPTYSIFKSSWGSAWNVYRYVSAESGGTSNKALVGEAALGLARQISTVNNLFKAYMVAQYGRYTSSTGNLLLNAPKQDAFMVAMGLSPDEMQDRAAQMDWLSNRTNAVKDVTNSIVHFRSLFALAIDQGDTGKADSYSDQMEIMMKLVPPDIRTEALKQANGRDGTKSAVEIIGRKFEQESAKKKQGAEQQALEKGTSN